MLSQSQISQAGWSSVCFGILWSGRVCFSLIYIPVTPELLSGKRSDHEVQGQNQAQALSQEPPGKYLGCAAFVIKNTRALSFLCVCFFCFFFLVNRTKSMPSLAVGLWGFSPPLSFNAIRFIFYSELKRKLWLSWLLKKSILHTAWEMCKGEEET